MRGYLKIASIFRYFAPIQLEYRVTHERLTRICFNDYDREIAIVVAGQTPET
jgi:acetyltransferase